MTTEDAGGKLRFRFAPLASSAHQSPSPPTLQLASATNNVARIEAHFGGDVSLRGMHNRLCALPAEMGKGCTFCPAGIERSESANFAGYA